MPLYVVASPIGNMDEITLRALQVLSEVDIVAAEDTRNTGLFLRRLNINAKLIAYHKFNEISKQDFLLEKLKAGESIALISDAGTPCISDPGYLLVKAAADAGVEVIGISGACAAILALSVSGFPAEPFLYLGFLPRKAGAIVEIMPDGHTAVFYESPKRIASTMALMTEHFPDAQICLCNDLTKKFEKIYRGSPAEVLAELAANPHSEKGEYTCVASIPPQLVQDENAPSIESQLIDVMVKTGCTVKEAIKKLDYPKNKVYAASLRLKELLK